MTNITSFFKQLVYGAMLLTLVIINSGVLKAPGRLRRAKA